MPQYTPKLNLFKYNTSTDGKEVFSIDKSMNENWDKLETNISIVEYNKNTIFTQNDWVKADNTLYKSLQNNNKNHSLQDSTWWEEIKFGSSQMPVGCVNSGNKDNNGKPDLIIPSHTTSTQNLPDFKSEQQAKDGIDDVTVSPSSAWQVIGKSGSISVPPGHTLEIILDFHDTILPVSFSSVSLPFGANQRFDCVFRGVYGSNDKQKWDTLNPGNDSIFTYTDVEIETTTKYRYIKFKYYGTGSHSFTSYMKSCNLKYQKTRFGKILNFKVDNGSKYKPLVATFIDGTTQTYNSIPQTIALEDSSNYIMLKKNGTTECITKRFIQPTMPEQLQNNVWLDNSQLPLKQYKFNNGQWITYDAVCIGFVLTQKDVIKQQINITFNELNASQKDKINQYMPDYTAGIKINQNYEVQYPGIVYLTLQTRGTGGESWYVYVNNIPIMRLYANYYNVDTGFTVLVSTGDIINWTTYGTANVLFYPMKGAK